MVRLPLADRFLWIWLYRLWPRVLDKMILVKPKTVIEWHYKGFRLFWRWKSRSRPWRRIPQEARDLIYQMKRDNPLWGSERIAAELEKIGFSVCHSTVLNYLPKVDRPGSPGWKIFIRNHMKETAAVDFFVVVTLSYRLLYGIVLLNHSRRRILHIEVTKNPTQEWAADQVRRAFLKYPKPKILVRDRDAIYGKVFRAQLDEMGIKEFLTHPQSPWQNGYAERVIGSIRRECLDHVIVFSEGHLRRLLSSYVQYYNYSRTHRGLGQDCPVHRPIERPIRGKVVAVPLVGGLHHRYERRAA